MSMILAWIGFGIGYAIRQRQGQAGGGTGGAPPPESGPSLDFSNELNSQYVALLEDF
jgi:hypothetical protein